MLPPLSHLDACNYNDYALQLSVYMYIMLKHNRSLEKGVIQMDHVEFEIESLFKATAYNILHTECPTYWLKDNVSMIKNWSTT